MWRLISVLSVGSVCLGMGAAAAAQPLQTAIVDPTIFAAGSPEIAFRHAAATGSGFVRLTLDWHAVAPPTTSSQFNPTDPGSDDYNWTPFDDQVTGAVDAGLTPLVSVVGMPKWAGVDVGGSAPAPRPADLRRFAIAAARRYSGALGLPRVRYWQVWNEPNISLYFRPQFVNGRPFSPGWYRRMVNEVAAAVKSVRADNLVIAGGTAPFRDITPEVQKIDPRWGRSHSCVSCSASRTR